MTRHFRLSFFEVLAKCLNKVSLCLLIESSSVSAKPPPHVSTSDSIAPSDPVAIFVFRSTAGFPFRIVSLAALRSEISLQSKVGIRLASSFVT